MIINAILNFLVVSLTVIVNLFPAVNSDTISLINAFSTNFRSYFILISYVFPVNYFFGILLNILLIETILFGINMTRRLLKLIHVLG